MLRHMKCHIHHKTTHRHRKHSKHNPSCLFKLNDVNKKSQCTHYFHKAHTCTDIIKHVVVNFSATITFWKINTSRFHSKQYITWNDNLITRVWILNNQPLMETWMKYDITCIITLKFVQNNECQNSIAKRLVFLRTRFHLKHTRPLEAEAWRHKLSRRSFWTRFLPNYNQAGIVCNKCFLRKTNVPLKTYYSM